MKDVKEWVKYAVVLSIAIVAYIILNLLIFFGIINNYYGTVMIFIGINIILAVSLNLINGITGQLSLGHAGFMSVGAYASSILSIKLGIPFVIAILIGGIAAAIIGLLVGFPTLRLKGDYLAITTLGFGEIIRVVFQNVNYVGGARGLMGIPKNTNFTVVFIASFIVVLVIINIVNSTHGRALKSIREDEIAAQAMGINTVRYKIFAFSLAAFFAGIGGGLFAHYAMYINPSQFGFLKSMDYVIMVVMGGLGSITGSIIAAIVLTILPEFLRVINDYRMIIYALALILIMLYRPQGLMGNVEFSVSRMYNKLINKTSKKGVK